MFGRLIISAKDMFPLRFCSVFIEGVVLVLASVPQKGSDGSGSGFDSWENGPDSSGFRFRFGSSSILYLMWTWKQAQEADLEEQKLGTVGRR